MRVGAEQTDDPAPGSSLGAFGSRVGARFHIERVPTLVTSGFRAANLAVTEIWDANPIIEVTDALPTEDAYMLCAQAADVVDHEIWENGGRCRGEL